MLSFDVIGREAVPDDIRRVAGHVIKDCRVDLQVVYKSKKTDARTDAGTDNADLFVTLLF